MKKLFQFGLLFAAFCALFGRADAADDSETRSIPIDARVVRVKLDGVIDLKLRQGDVASLRLIGEKRYLDKLTASQSGDTLHLETEGAASRSAAAPPAPSWCCRCCARWCRKAWARPRSMASAAMSWN
jgi:hypothetical protein